MTSVPPPSQPSSWLPPQPGPPPGIAPGPPPPAADGRRPDGSLGGVPAWAPLAALIVAFVVATLAYAVTAAAVVAGGDKVTSTGPPGVVIFATLIQDGALIAAAVLFASFWSRGLTPASFGLRTVSPARAAGWLAATLAAFWILSLAYFTIVGQPDQQELTRELRNEESLAAVIGYGFLVAFAAPLAEEFFFRGFVFGVLRERIGVGWGVAATGLMFGVVHAFGSPIETLGVLIILGVLLCVLYQQTGSLLPCIALHSINNAISFASTKSLAWPEAIVVVLACAGAAVGVGAAVTQRQNLFSRA